MPHIKRMTKATANTLINEGASYFSKGETNKAISKFLLAVSKNPNSVEANFNLGFVYLQEKDYEKSILYLEKTCILKQGDKEALRFLGTAYANFGATMLYKDPPRALKALEKAEKIIPKNTNVLYNISNAYQAMGQTQRSLNVLRRIITIDPKFEHSYGQLYLKLRTFAYWGEANNIFKKMKKISDKSLKLKKITAETPFVSVCTSENPKRNFEIAKCWAKQDKDIVSEYKFNPKYTKKDKNEPIRIGYLSYDFHDHATMHLLMGVLRNHNKDKFKIYAYSYGISSDKFYRNMAQKYVDTFRDIRFTLDLKAAEIINKDGIDILVDLKGHTSGTRLGILALKPAPVSVTWLGFPGTSGANYINYILTDKIVTPPSESKYYSEEIIYLPDCYQPTDNEQEISQRVFTRAHFGLSGDPNQIIISSFNQPRKIDSICFDSWMRILKRVPNSTLWLFTDSEVAKENLIDEAKKRGIDSNRLIFTSTLPKEEHLKRIQLSDIALDTFTYNGHTTTSDCLWAGVPVVTLKGKHFASRVSASLLTSIGMSELITNSQKDYEDLIVKLAKSPKLLKSIRSKLQSNKLVKPLFDTKKFTKNLENIYEKIYKSVKW